MPTSGAMMAITTSSSMSVKALARMDNAEPNMGRSLAAAGRPGDWFCAGRERIPQKRSGG
jgi:hypothetical protein